MHGLEAPLPVNATATVAGEGGEEAASATVQVEVAWERRWHHMAQHSCQHLVTALAVQLFGLETLSWGLGPEVSFLELGAPEGLTDGQLHQLEAAANEGASGGRGHFPRERERTIESERGFFTGGRARCAALATNDPWLFVLGAA